jgi:hypothetical protein
VTTKKYLTEHLTGDQCLPSPIVSFLCHPSLQLLAEHNMIFLKILLHHPQLLFSSQVGVNMSTKGPLRRPYLRTVLKQFQLIATFDDSRGGKVGVVGYRSVQNIAELP